MKTPTTMSREKSTGGADGGRPGARACRPQTATHSSRLRMTTCAGSCIPLTNPFAKVEKGTACPTEAITRPDERIGIRAMRSEEHTSELQSRLHLVCRLLLEKKKTDKNHDSVIPHTTTT